jgi:hypothetical protein
MNTKKLVLTALTVTLLGGGAAIAGPGNNGNSNGHGARNNGNNGNGVIASELKWRNAAHASEQARLNASPNSAVGIIATYENATQELNDALEAAGLEPGTEIRDPADIQADIDLLEPPTRTIADIEADLAQAIIDGEDTTDLANELAGAEAYEAQLAELEAELEVSEGLTEVLAAEADASAAVGVDELSEPALEALWDMLNN